jgi:hypothetical protein
LVSVRSELGGVIRAGFRPRPVPAGDDLAQARCVPPKHERAGVVGDRRDGHDFFARFCLIRSGCTRRIPAVRARRIAGPRP